MSHYLSSGEHETAVAAGRPLSIQAAFCDYRGHTLLLFGFVIATLRGVCVKGQTATPHKPQPLVGQWLAEHFVADKVSI